MPDALWHFSGQALAILAALFTLWALFADRAKGRKRCRKCWYDLAAIGELPVTCPECGKPHTKPKHLTRTRYRRAIIGLVFLIASYGLWTTPRVIARGWSGAVPTALLMIWPAVVVPSYADQSAMDLRDISHWSLIAESERRWAEMPLFQKRITIWCWRETNAVKPGPDYTTAGLLFRSDIDRGILPQAVVREWLFDTLRSEPLAVEDVAANQGRTEIEIVSIPWDSYLMWQNGEKVVTETSSPQSIRSNQIIFGHWQYGWYGRSLRLAATESGSYNVVFKYRTSSGKLIHAFQATYGLSTRNEPQDAFGYTPSAHILVPIQVQPLNEAPQTPPCSSSPSPRAPDKAKALNNSSKRAPRVSEGASSPHDDET